LPYDIDEGSHYVVPHAPGVEHGGPG